MAAEVAKEMAVDAIYAVSARLLGHAASGEAKRHSKENLQDGQHTGHGADEHQRGQDDNGDHGAHERIDKDLLCLVIFWIIIWASGRLAGITRLSPLLYYLLFGCVIGNMGFGFMDLESSGFMRTFSVFAIAVVFYALGLEENVSNFLNGIKKAWGIASIGAIVPFIVGFLFTSAFWPGDINVALMGGLAVTATAVSLTMIALKAEGLATSKPAIGIMTSAVLDDIASLAFVAVTVPIATGGSISILGIIGSFSKAGGFFLVVVIVHMFILPDNPEEGPLSKIPGLKNFGVRHILEYNKGEQATLLAMTIGMLWGVLAVGFGFHPAIGAYMGGLIMEEKYFDTVDPETGKKHNTFHHVNHHIETVAYCWLGPFFFIELGSMIEISGPVLASSWWKVILFFIALFIGQFVSAAGAARYVPGGFSWYESAMIGFGMMGRAELFFVVLEICYISHKIMTKEIVCTFALTAMLMNISVPVCITLYKPIYVKWLADNGRLDEMTGPGGGGGHVDGHDANGHKELEDGKDHGTGFVSGQEDVIKKTTDGIQIGIDGVKGDEVKRDRDASTNGGEMTEKSDSDNSPTEKPYRSKSRQLLLPQVCGCMTVPENGVLTKNNSYGPTEGKFNH